MRDPFAESLRASLEAWEPGRRLLGQPDPLAGRAAARQSPGRSDARHSPAHHATLESAGLPGPAPQQDGARALYLLERIAHQLDDLAARIADLGRGWMNPDLFEGGARLWDAGLRAVWQQYTAAGDRCASRAARWPGKPPPA